MPNISKEIIGSCVQALGTIISAIGSTPSITLNNKERKALDLWGNVLQAVGNGLEAEGGAQDQLSNGILGNEIQSIGNVVETASIIFEDVTVTNLASVGDWLQALGGLVNAAEDFDNEAMAGQVYNMVGNLTQAIGNSMQALSEIQPLQGDGDFNNSQILNSIGSWIQAVGAVPSMLGQIVMYEEGVG